MGTTPNRGFPYPEGTDYVASGDDAIQALAEAVDTALSFRLAATGIGGAENIGADMDWTLDYANMDSAAGFTPVPDDGVAPRFTYTGPAGRYFLISAGVSLSSDGADELLLTVLAGGTIIGTAHVAGPHGHLSLTVPWSLTPNTDLYAVVRSNGAAGSYVHSYLHAVSL